MVITCVIMRLIKVINPLRPHDPPSMICNAECSIPHKDALKQFQGNVLMIGPAQACRIRGDEKCGIWCSGLSSFVLWELKVPSVSFAGFRMSALELLGRSGKDSVVTQT